MNIKQLNILLLVILIAALLAGCAAQERKPDQVEEVPEPGAIAQQEYVNVYAYGGDDWTATWQPKLEEPATFSLYAEADSATTADPLRQIQGFRIQLADVLSRAEANLTRQHALNFFDNVYINYRSPNYKVRAGDFKKRSEAQLKLDQVRREGFRDAWIVPDYVYVTPPERPVNTDSLSAAADSLQYEILQSDSTGVIPDSEN